MQPPGRCFPYEKSIVINALYDTIEALGLGLDSADSARGTLVVSDPQQTGRMRIVLSAAGNADRTQVSAYPEDPDARVFNTWSAVVLDELSGTIERARRDDKRNRSKGGKAL